MLAFLCEVSTTIAIEPQDLLIVCLLAKLLVTDARDYTVEMVLRNHHLRSSTPILYDFPLAVGKSARCGA